MSELKKGGSRGLHKIYLTFVLNYGIMVLR